MCASLSRIRDHMLQVWWWPKIQWVQLLSHLQWLSHEWSHGAVCCPTLLVLLSGRLCLLNLCLHLHTYSRMDLLKQWRMFKLLIYTNGACEPIYRVYYWPPTFIVPLNYPAPYVTWTLPWIDVPHASACQSLVHHFPSSFMNRYTEVETCNLPVNSVEALVLFNSSSSFSFVPLDFASWENMSRQ